MDPKQSHLRQAQLILPVLFVAILLLTGCNSPSPPVDADLERAVAATLTAHARQAASTEALPPGTASPTNTPSPPPPSPSPSASPLPATATPAPGEVPGVISGTLSYPSESIPRLAVVFFNQDDGSWWWIGTAVGQSNFRMTVPVGRYHVVAYGQGDLAGGYTAAVPCGLTAGCTDHSLLPVVVGSNARVTDIHVGDWYAPAGAFPAKPSAIEYP